MGTDISKNTQKTLLAIARAAIAQKLNIEFENPLASPEKIDPQARELLDKNYGIFVSLHINKELRGCIGVIETQKRLAKTLPEHAIYAAFNDSRFNPLRPDEFDKIKIEISLLTPPKPLEYKDAQDLLNKLIPLKHGVVIRKSFFSATFLPQVWEQIPAKEDFLSHLCAKAGLDSNEWKRGDIKITTYEAEVFSDTPEA
ncbi:AmmeMemoRadiSam system protein A [Candidatus Peregrinibacteria bacterium]|nr:AmmeMemoRadiSam system protein A [Candidatus Peregrinibacteria bacterium]